MENLAPTIPRAFAALDQFPALRASVESSLRQQAARVAAALARFQPRPAIVAALEAAIDGRAGVVALEGPPGSGVTSLLAALAARRPHPLWLVADDGGQGAVALYAQIVALCRPAVPLIDPAAATDPITLGRLLAEAAEGRAGQGPLVLLVDWPADQGQPARALPPPFPSEIPPGVVVLFGCAPGTALPLAPALRLRLPDDDPEIGQALGQALAALGGQPAWAAGLTSAAQGSFLYLELAHAMLRDGQLDPADLPAGLDSLLARWWGGLDATAQKLALLLAAAGEPLPLPLLARLLGADPEPALAAWEGLGLVDLTVQAGGSRESAGPLLLAAFAQGALRGFLARTAPADLAQAHAELAGAALGLIRSGPPRDRLAGLFGPDPAALYLSRQFARHAALAGADGQALELSQVIEREWVRARARRDGLEAAMRDAAWELRAAARPCAPLRAAHAAALVGSLASSARTLSADAAVEALLAGLERGGREPALKRVLDLVERLPDGHDKAAILRRLGEACYGARMRSSAMRLLSRALDLEAQPISRAWREQREQLLGALAVAALDLDAVDCCLAIAERIEHLERRAQIETLVARRLVAMGDLDRAQRVARAILHESMGAWAQAEVAVELARSADPRGSMMLEEISIETVAAWAQIELACDAAASDEEAAFRRIEALPAPNQRDRGLARLAHALALAGKDGDALAAAERIGAVEARVAALIDLRLGLEGLVANLALERATSDAGSVTGDDRAPLLAALAAAHAALGRQDRALGVVGRLAVGEERDRALARVAVALAQRGEHQQARETLESLADDDERDWARDEIARQLAAAGRWDDALLLVGQIGAADQREQTMADLAIERARSGPSEAALALALAIDAPAERARALILIGPLLVAAGQIQLAQNVAQHPGALGGAEARGRYLTALVAALVEHGHFAQASELALALRRPNDRARALISLARALADSQQPGAADAVGMALCAAAIGREELFRALEQAAPVLARLGGPALLSGLAIAVDEIDR